MKPIKGFSSYFVDKDGTITTKNGKILKHFSDNYGYSCVSLRKDGKSYTKRVHRLVGETYLKPVKGKDIINHKDGNKKNCHIDNLEYMSNAENTKHGYDNNLYKSKSMLPIIVTDLEGNHLGDYRSIRAVSDQLKVNRKTLSSILNDDRKNNYNYNFKYKDNEEEENMDKIASYKEVIYKEASNQTGRPDYSKIKTIHLNPSEYTVRDSNFREKVMYNAGVAGKKIKDEAKSGAKTLKKVKGNKVAKGAALAVATLPVLGHMAEKKGDKERENRLSTNIQKDSLNADMARRMKLIPVSAANAAGSSIALIKGSRAGRNLGKTIVDRRNIKNVNRAARIVSNSGKAVGIGAGLTVYTAGSKLQNKMERNMASNKLDKLSEQYIGRKATDTERKRVTNLYDRMPLGMKVSTITPETEIQKIRRQRDKNKKEQ